MLKEHDQECDDSMVEWNDTSTPKSTKMPLKPKPKSMKKKLQEEEFQVMKGLASSIALDQKEKKKAKAEGELEAFGYFIIESIRKLDSTTQHIVQYQINNILFQAQMGMLGQGRTQLPVFQQQNNNSVHGQSFTPQQFPPWMNHHENMLDS